METHEKWKSQDREIWDLLGEKQTGKEQMFFELCAWLTTNGIPKLATGYDKQY